MATQQEIADHLDMSDRQVREILTNLNMNHRIDSLDAIRIAYIRDLREKAAGRAPNSHRERLDMAKADEAEANTALKMRELWKQDQLLLDYDSVYHLLMGWTLVAINELTRAVNNVVSAIESKHSITVDREITQSRIDAARRTIANHADEFEAPRADDQNSLDTAA